MSRCLPQSPTVTRSGTTPTTVPPAATSVAVPLNPICSQYSGAITVEPDVTN